LRELERDHHAGDAAATKRLARAYERAGDQAALCELGQHDLDASRPEWDDGLQRRPASPGELAYIDVERSAFYVPVPYLRAVAPCTACSARVPVQWVVELTGAALDLYRSRLRVHVR
jgi:hypothetical protein